MGRFVNRHRWSFGRRLSGLRCSQLRTPDQPIAQLGGQEVTRRSRLASVVAWCCVVATVLGFAPACGSDEIDASQRSVLDAVEEVDALDAAAAASFVDEHAADLLSEGVADAADGAALAGVFRE